MLNKSKSHKIVHMVHVLFYSGLQWVSFTHILQSNFIDT